MIITLKGADFSASNIGTLSSWRITRSLGAGATYAGPISVGKGAALTATVTLAEGYEISAAGVTITMGGNVISAATVNGNVITINIAEVTGNVVIKVPTINTNTGEEEEPDIPVIPDNPDDGEDVDVYSLLNFNEQIPYLKTPSVTSAIPEVLSASTLKISNSGTGKNLIVDVPKPTLVTGDTYTMAFRMLDYTEDMVTARVKPYIKWQGGTAFQIATTAANDMNWYLKSFTAEDEYNRIVIGCATNSEFTTATNFTIEARIYQGTLTEMPAEEV